MAPGKRPIRELAAKPVVYALLIGSAFGLFECFCYPQIKHKPALLKK
jgi:hypothetical protein